jgi:hypothetical protein
MLYLFCNDVTNFKLETLKIKYHLNHFAIKAKLWIGANLSAFNELQRLKGV